MCKARTKGKTKHEIDKDSEWSTHYMSFTCGAIMNAISDARFIEIIIIFVNNITVLCLLCGFFYFFNFFIFFFFILFDLVWVSFVCFLFVYIFFYLLLSLICFSLFYFCSDVRRLLSVLLPGQMAEHRTIFLSFAF